MPAQVTLPVMGHVEYFGIAFEATYGTPLNPNIFYRPARNTLRALPVTEGLEGPGGVFARFKNETAPNIPRHLRLPSDRSGQVVLELDYDSVGWLLTNLMGQPTFAAFQGTGGQHVWTLPGTIPTLGPPSITCTRNHALPNKDYRIGGCLINKAVFRGQAGRLITVTLDIVGATGGEPAGAIGSTYTAPNIGTLSVAPFVEFIHSDISVAPDADPFNQAVLIPYSGSGADVSDWTLTYDNQYDISPSAGGGNLGIRQPTWQSAPLITLEYTQRWTPIAGTHTFNEFDLMHQTTETKRYKYVRVEMVHPTLDAGGGPINVTLRMDFPAGIFLGDPPV